LEKGKKGEYPEKKKDAKTGRYLLPAIEARGGKKELKGEREIEVAIFLSFTSPISLGGGEG